MRLPGLEHRSVPIAKITAYLLDPNHAYGGSKARFFMRFGFDRDAPAMLAQALFDHGAAYDVSSSSQLHSGVSYAVEGPLFSPDGRMPWVRSIWFTAAGGKPTLVTAYPVRRRG